MVWYVFSKIQATSGMFAGTNGVDFYVWHNQGDLGIIPRDRARVDLSVVLICSRASPNAAIVAFCETTVLPSFLTEAMRFKPGDRTLCREL